MSVHKKLGITMDKEFLNLLVKKCAKKQNPKKKLNAGQWREAIKIVGSVVGDLSRGCEIQIDITHTPEVKCKPL